VVIVEHDPSLYEDAEKISEYIYQALRDLANRAAVVWCASSADPYLEEMSRRADGSSTCKDLSSQ
jgi:hypothetical protein